MHGVGEGHAFFHEQSFNAGQHIAHNQMLDECVRLGVDWHVRVDDDCFLSNRKWLPRLLKLQETFKERLGHYVVLSPAIDGLDNPPPAFGKAEFGKENIEQVDILGGIFRMSPMNIMRYFRWDERLPMGFGEAAQFASFCRSIKMDMMRVADMHITHGDSTQRQQVRDPIWSYEHDMLQYVPFGL